MRGDERRHGGTKWENGHVKKAEEEQSVARGCGKLVLQAWAVQACGHA